MYVKFLIIVIVLNKNFVTISQVTNNQLTTS